MCRNHIQGTSKKNCEHNIHSKMEFNYEITFPGDYDNFLFGIKAMKRLKKTIIYNLRTY